MSEEACTIWVTRCHLLVSLRVKLILFFYGTSILDIFLYTVRSVILVESSIFILGREYYELGKHRASFQS